MSNHPAQKRNPSQPARNRNYWLECAKRGLTDEALVKSALEQLSINPNDETCHIIITEAINKHDTQELLYPEPFRRFNPAGNQLSGEIKLGVVLHTGAIWGISPALLTTHLLLVGRTGGGKTSVIKSIIKQLIKKRSI